MHGPSAPESARAWRSGPATAVRDRVQELIDASAAAHTPLEVLDAGCGSSARFSLPASARRTGIDISPLQLERNHELDEKILGDVQEYRLPAGRYHLIICWTLLEHLPEPKRALDNLVAALAPDGLLVVGVPNVLSTKGLVTKFTPLKAHVWFYRKIHGSTVAGHDDLGPFPTYLRMAISSRGLQRYAERSGLAMPFLATYEGAMQRRARARFGVVGMRWRAIRAAIIAATLGTIDPAATEVVAVMQRSASPPVDAHTAGRVAQRESGAAGTPGQRLTSTV